MFTQEPFTILDTVSLPVHLFDALSDGGIVQGWAGVRGIVLAPDGNDASQSNTV